MASEYHGAIFQACKNRRMFAKATGFLRLGPRTMKAGDMVSALHGSRIPYILRPIDYRAMLCCSETLACQLVGHCYLEGIMQGEAAEKY